MQPVKDEGHNVGLAITTVASKVRQLLALADRDEVLARHRVGELLRATKGAPETYGTHAIDQISREVGIAPRLLYSYVAIAETWSAAELHAHLCRANQFGRILSWSHFVALARVKQAGVRQELLDRCLGENWSVRDLNGAIDRSVERGGGESAATRGEGIRVALKESIQTGSRAIANLRSLGDALADRLSDRTEPVDEALLDRAVNTFEELYAHAGSTLTQLRSARRSETRIRVPDTRVPAPRVRENRREGTTSALASGPSASEGSDPTGEQALMALGATEGRRRA